MTLEEGLELINNYKNTHGGVGPTGKDLSDIDNEVADVGRASFLGNMALLSITEYVQLPKLLGSSYAAERQASNSLLGKADDVLLDKGKYIAKEATTKFGKLYNRAAGVSRYVFDPKEGGQELGQYALQVGTQNYYKKSRETGAANMWTDGFVYGFVGKSGAPPQFPRVAAREALCRHQRFRQAQQLVFGYQHRNELALARKDAQAQFAVLDVFCERYCGRGSPCRPSACFNCLSRQ